MKYEKTEYFNGDLAKAIEIAKSTLLPNGFEITGSSSSNLEVTNHTGLWGSNQHPLGGVSKAHIFGGDGKITIKAELGGVVQMIKYLNLFIAGMAVFFLVTFGFLFGLRQGQPIGKIVLMSLVPFVPWPIIIPLIGVWFKKRACRALDTLLNNMINVGQA